MTSNVVSRSPIRGDEWSKGFGHHKAFFKSPTGSAADGSSTRHSTRGFFHYLRSTLSLVLLSMLVVIGGTSVYLQYQQLKECIRDGLPVNEDQINQPSELQLQLQSRSRLIPNTEEKDPKTIINGNETHLSHQTIRMNLSNTIDTVNIQPSTTSSILQEITVTSPPEQDNVKTTGTIPTNQSLEPILVYSNMGFEREEPCDIPCVYTAQPDRRRDADASVYERRGYYPPDEGDRFSIYLQMEGEHYYPISLEGYQLENSYRWISPLLKPYFEWIHYTGENNISNPPVSFNSTIDGASFIARNCASMNNREEVVVGLRRAGFRVDGLSTCLQTKTPGQSDDKLAMMRPYKFNLAFENGNVQDYVTEKVYQALAAGVVPIYLGAPNIRDYVPDHSIINVAEYDFNTTLLAQHLKDCMNNASLYESYHAWRFQPLPAWFQRKFNFTWDTTECRTCRYIHAMKNGWKWDHETQRGIPPTR